MAFGALVLLNTANAQLSTYNRLSLDLSAGINKPMEAFTPGYSTGYASLFHADLGLRYMLNSKFGLKFDYAHEKFENAKKSSNKFVTSYDRITFQGVVNLGRVCNFEDWTQKLSFLVHGGPGLGILSGESKANVKGTDKTGLFVLGGTAMLKLSEKVALTGDLSMYGTILQSHTFDYKGITKTRGFDGYFGTMSVGVTISLGKNTKSVDWMFEDSGLQSRIDSLEIEILKMKTNMDTLGGSVREIREDMRDSDNDGVANYLDEEPNTPKGAIVNTKGVEIKMPDIKDLIGQDTLVSGGLFYTVQLGVYSRMLPEQFWRNIKPIYVLNIEDGTKRYFTQIHHSVEEASVTLNEMQKLGVNDAFITAYYRGKRITVAEADLILSTKGPSVLRKK